MKAARIHEYGQPLVLEVASRDRINDVYRQLERGDVRGRAVIQPAA